MKADVNIIGINESTEKETKLLKNIKVIGNLFLWIVATAIMIVITIFI